MGIRYDGLKLFWLRQNLTSNTTITWTAPLANMGTYYGGTSVSIPLKTLVINGPHQPVVYTLTGGSLPLGLSLSGNTLIGTLNNVAGSYTFTITATCGTASTPQTFTVGVAQPQSPAWTTSAALGGQIETTAFNLQLAATDPQGLPLSYSLVAGSLPFGVGLTSNGLLSGTLGAVASNQTFNFTLAVSNGPLSVNQAFSFTIEADAPPVWLTAANLGDCVEGYPFSATLVANSAYPLSYSLVSGSLPPGLSLSNTGVINGTVGTVTVPYQNLQFMIQATDGVRSSSQLFNIEVLENLPPSWVSTGIVLQQYSTVPASATLNATTSFSALGAVVTYSLANGSSLPTGMSLAANGLLSGSLPTVGSQTDYTFVAVANDGLEASSRSFKIRDIPLQAPVWNSTNSVGTVNELTPFSVQLSATDPQGFPLTYSLIGGALPSGLTLSSTGLISGVTTIVSNTTTSNFTVQASDGYAQSSQNLSITVNYRAAPTWVTAGGNANLLATGLEGTAFAPVTLVANSAYGPMTYTSNGLLPGGLYLGAANGVLFGTFPLVGTDTLDPIDVIAHDTTTGKTAEQVFYIDVLHSTNPQWVSPLTSTTVSNFTGTPVSLSLVANATDNEPVSFSVVSGTLPNSLTLTNTGNGTATITGTLPTATQTTTYVAGIGATDGYSKSVLSFTFTSLVDQPPIWNTTSLPSQVEGAPFNHTLSAYDAVLGSPITFSMANGTQLPNGLTLSSNGVISGLLPEAQSDVGDTINISVAAFDGRETSYQNFTFVNELNASPVWNTPSETLATIQEFQTFSVQLQATDPHGLPLTYSVIGELPPGFSLSNSGLFAGTAMSVPQNTNFDFNVQVENESPYDNNSAVQSFSLQVNYFQNLNDPFSNSVALYAPFEGSITDTVGGHTLGVNGAYVDTTQALFGNSSVRLLGANATSFTIPTDSDPTMNMLSSELGAEAYPVTTEFWVLPTSLTTNGNAAIMTLALGSGQTVAVYQNNNTLYFEATQNNFDAPGGTFSYEMPAPVWTHVAITNPYHSATASNRISFYVNGNYLGFQGIFDVGGAVPPVTFGGGFDGWIDNLRVTRAERYTGNFIPTAVPNYPVWITNAGVLTSVLEGQSFSTSIAASDPYNLGQNTYYLANNTTLPTGVTLATNGTISGSIPLGWGGAAINFTAAAQDGNGNWTPQEAFSISTTAESAPSSLQVSWRFNG